MNDQLTEVYASIDALTHATQTGPATKSSPSSA